MPMDEMVSGCCVGLIQAWHPASTISSSVSKTRLESRFWRRYCQMSSWGFSSGERGGRKMMEMLAGTTSLGVVCHPALSNGMAAWAPLATWADISARWAFMHCPAGDCVTPKACFQHDAICREGRRYRHKASSARQLCPTPDKSRRTARPRWSADRQVGAVVCPCAPIAVPGRSSGRAASRPATTVPALCPRADAGWHRQEFERRFLERFEDFAVLPGMVWTA